MKRHGNPGSTTATRTVADGAAPEASLVHEAEWGKRP